MKRKNKQNAVSCFILNIFPDFFSFSKRKVTLVSSAVRSLPVITFGDVQSSKDTFSRMSFNVFILTCVKIKINDFFQNEFFKWCPSNNNGRWIFFPTSQASLFVSENWKKSTALTDLSIFWPQVAAYSVKFWLKEVCKTELSAFSEANLSATRSVSRSLEATRFIWDNLLADLILRPR